MAAEAAMFADEAALMADVAAEDAAIAAVLASVDGVVTMVVDDVDGVGVVMAGGVMVVVDSSFLLQAANETAAARVTINRAVFMFLLDFKFGQSRVIVGTLVIEESHRLQDKESTSISNA